MPVNAALLFTDLVDSTLITQRLGDERAAELWNEHDRRARDLLRRHRGREIGRSDGFLLLFDMPDDAVRYALDYHAQLADLGIAARAGVHLGPVVVRRASDDDVALGAKRTEIEGLALALAARVMAMAGPGQTLMTEAAKQALDPGSIETPVHLHSHGHYRLKGIEEPVAIHEIGIASQCSFVPPADGDKSYRVAHDGELWRPVRDIPHRLPAEPDKFVGRGADLDAIGGEFEAGTRLLTLLGPGGTGKTRLALRYARGSLGDWPGGAWFCDLSEAASLEGIYYEAGRVLGKRIDAGDAAVQITDAIAGRGRCLIVLDNFEQVAQHAAATVGRWLNAPEASFLVTSRERLAVPGEVVQLVEPLPLDSAAIELFVTRARAARHDFALDDARRGAVAEIVRLLDGLPLAIELAAARMLALTPSQLLLRLHDRFKVLAGRRGVTRQATLRAAIDWSWQLLNEHEQSALAQCSVFEGGFTLAAAEAVIDLTGAVDVPAAVDVLQALVDKSLLRRWIPHAAAARHDIDEPYFGMYISIHEFVAEKARERGTAFAHALDERHGRYFAAFGTDAALEGLFTQGGRQRHLALARELDNLTAACHRAVTRRDGAAAVGCYRAAWEVLALQGPFGVAVALGDEVLAIEGLDERLAEQARLTHGEALVRIGDTEGLEAKLRESLERVRAIGDRTLEARILGRLGNVCLWAGRLDDAHAHYAGALACAKAVAHRLLEARMHGNLAIVFHERGRADEAVAEYESALRIEREIGSQRDEAITLCNFADLLGGQGRIERARSTFGAALALLRELGDRDTEAVTLQQLGEFEVAQGLIDEGLATLREALAQTRVVGNRRIQGHALQSLGGALIEKGRFDEAREALEQALHIARAASNRRIEAHTVAGLGELEFREGRREAGAAHLANAEATLRELDDKPLLANVLSARGHVDLARGDAPAARAALREARALAAAINAGPSSGLSRQIERLACALGEPGG
jgi:predicted ATPase/class 3 adenylate cyclase/Tfp pilus assembly protein PilF